MEYYRDNKRYFELAEKWMQGKITAEEEKEFSNWYNSDQNKTVEIPVEFVSSSYAHEERMLKKLNEKIAYKQEKRLKRLRIISGAAAAIISSLIIFFYQQNSEQIEDQQKNAIESREIGPGSNKAILTLSTGKRINLTDVNNGAIAGQAGINITKTTDGLVVYQNSETTDFTATTAFNTIETPTGGQYQVQLPDGSNVYLNANSSITFPTKFSRQVNREIKLIGEAFFEVKSDLSKPFIVKTGKQEIRVLGTRFNVNAYNNEGAIKTTLFEGSVQVSSSSGKAAIMKPGQQSTLYHDQLDIKEVNPDEFNSWTNGYFWFNNENIESIMRKFSRWYDIEVSYQGKISNQEFNGKISRNKNLNQVLKILEQTEKIHFKIEGRRILVISK